MLDDLVKLLESLPAPLPKARLVESEYLTLGQVVRIPPSEITTIPIIVIHSEDAEKLRREWCREPFTRPYLGDLNSEIAGVIEQWFKQMETERHQRN